MKATRAKLFQNGGSQATPLRKASRFTGQREVLVRREGRPVILEPADEWSAEFRACLGSVSDDIPRPKQVPVTRLRSVLG